MTQGTFSLSARLSSLLGAMVVHYRAFLEYPAAIIGVLCIVGGLVSFFLLHEPKTLNELPEETRRPKRPAAAAKTAAEAAAVVSDTATNATDIEIS